MHIFTGRLTARADFLRPPKKALASINQGKVWPGTICSHYIIVLLGLAYLVSSADCKMAGAVGHDISNFIVLFEGV